MSPADVAAVSPDGTGLIAGRADDFTDVWALGGDPPTAAKRFTLTGHEGGLLDACYSPDGTRILTAWQDRTARPWDAATRAELLALRGHDAPVRLARFSRDGSAILTAADDGTVRLGAATRRDRGEVAANPN